MGTRRLGEALGFDDLIGSHLTRNIIKGMWALHSEGDSHMR